MNGTHLVRVTKAQGGFKIPLADTTLETMMIEQSTQLDAPQGRYLLLLEGELVLDLPDLEFAHLRSGEGLRLGVAPVRINPVKPSVVLWVG